MSMTDIDIDALRAKAEAARPGPWGRTTSGDPHWLREVRDANNWAVAWCGSNPQSDAHANAAYIAAMSPDVTLRLLDRIGSLERTR